MKYSIIIPAYNVENYIVSTLNSVMEQEFDDYEIIVVNDGSTDQTLKKVEEFIERKEYNKHIKIISQKNGGLGAARNTGIVSAEGEYLLFVDGDDTIEKDTLKEIDKVVNNETVDIIVFDYSWVDLEGNILSVTKGCNLKKGTFSLATEKETLLMPDSAVNKVIRKSLFTDNNILFPGRKLYEDVQTIPKLYYWAQSIIYLEKTLYNYVQRPNSIMNTKSTERTVEIIDAIEEVKKYYIDIGKYHEYQDEIEYLAVAHMLLDISMRVVKIDRNSAVLPKMYSYIKENYPCMLKNEYIKSLGLMDKFKLNLLLNRKYIILYTLLNLKRIIKR